jgi:hypothetical protein
MNRWHEWCLCFFFRHNSLLHEIYSTSENLFSILHILDARRQYQWMNNQCNHCQSLLVSYIHFLEYNSRSLIYHQIKCLRNCKLQFSTQWHHACSSSRLWWELLFSRVELEIILLTRWVILIIHIYFSYEAVRVHLFSRLTTIAKEMFWFFTIVTIEKVHL